MSDLSDFSESDFEKASGSAATKKDLNSSKKSAAKGPEAPKSAQGLAPKAALSRAKSGASPAPKATKDDSKAPSKKDDSKAPSKKDVSKAPPKQDEKKNDKTTGDQGSKSLKPEDDDRKTFKGRKSMREPGRSSTAGLDPQPAIDKATGVLSPPDFFISKIVHDSLCFTPKRGHSVVESGGFVYIFGGEDEDKKSTSAVIRFSPRTNSFELVEPEGDRPSPRRGATLNVWKPNSRAEPRLLLFGGAEDGDCVASESWVFELKTLTWKELKLEDSPDPRHSHAAVFSERENALFVFGGQAADGTVFGDAYALKGTTWSSISSANLSTAPPARCGHSASLCLLNGEDAVAIFGGDVTGGGKGDNGLWLYHPGDDHWEKMEQYAGEPPSPRWRHASAFFDNRLWVIGGTYGGWFRNYTMSDFYVFDFSAKCWFKCDVDPKELGCHADIGSLTVLPANRAMYIFGGADENGFPSSDVYRLAPVCTTVSLSALRQDMSRTVGEVKQVRSDMDSALQETQTLRASVTKLEGASDSVGKKLQEVVQTAQQAESRLKELAAVTQMLQEQMKRFEESLARAENSINAFGTVEKKVGIMEITLQETLAKLEQKTDASMRHGATRGDSIVDDDD